MELETALRELSLRMTELERTTQLRLAALEQQLARLAPQAPLGALGERPPGVPTFLPPVPAGTPAPSPSQPPPPRRGAPLPPPPPPGAAPFAPPPPPGVVAAVAAKPKSSFNDEAVLRWVGVGLVALAALFLVSAAISRGWITPELQLLGAAATGVALLGASAYFSEVNARREWSQALGLGGAVVLVASAAASYSWLDAVRPQGALFLVALAVALVGAVALFTRFDLVAATGVTVGLLATSDWVLALPRSVPVPWVVGLMVVSSILGLARGWPASRLIPGSVGALLLVGLCFAAGDGDLARGLTGVGLVLAVAVLWVGPHVTERRANRAATTKSESSWLPIDLRSLALIPAFTWLGVVGLGSGSGGDDAGTPAIAIALFFGLVAAVSWFLNSRVAALSTALGASGLLTVGLALAFEGPALMVAFAMNAVASFAIGHVLKDKPTQWAGAAAGLAASLVALWYTADAIGNDGYTNAAHALGALLIVGLWAAGPAYFYRSGQTASTWFAIALVGAWAGLMLWLAAVLLEAPNGLALVSAVWALMAGAGLAVGLTQRLEIARVVGLGTLAVTLLKLFTVDLEGVDVLARVAVFFVVGVGLIVLGMKVPALISSGKSKTEPQPPAPVS